MPADRRQEVAFTRFVLFGSLLLSIVLGTVAAVRGELSLLALVALLAVTAAVWFLISFLDGRGRSVTWLMSLGVLNLMLVVPELGLRVGGFGYESGIELQLTEEKAFQKLVRDPELFWKFDPERPEVNSWGFIGPEVEIPKPPGVFRVLYLGDSCAQWGKPHPYPAIVEKLLNEGATTTAGVERMESVSLSIAGYTSHQGLAVARRYGLLVEPDLVVLHYGWNDHWLAYGGPDHDIAASVLDGFFDACYRSSRLLQYAHFKARQTRQSDGTSGDGKPADLRQLLGSELQEVTRVPAERYRGNLLEMAAIFQDVGVPLVFVTPPSAHGVLGTPEHFVELGYATELESVIDLHTQYVEIVREVADDTNEHLLDLEKEMAGFTAEQLDAIFLFDGIHYARHGCGYVARRVAEYLRSEFDF